MKIRLGFELDGQHGEKPRNQLDEITTGPLGMLNILETQLGLLSVETGQAERVLQYRELLRRLNLPERFYRASFAVDELGTSATLLHWRDHWHLHGATAASFSSLKSSSSPRLQDLADIEAEAVASLAPGLGERLQKISQVLDTRTARIESVAVCEAIEAWPLAWQQVLGRLPVSPDSFPPQEANGLLGELQQTLLTLQQGGKPKPLVWRDDGSFQVVQAETQILAASWLGQALHSPEESTLLVAPQVGILDDMLAANHMPRQGFRELSAFRPALQVVPLALGQLWAPLDLYGLLKFLTHPICPVPAVARTRLAVMLARSPGIGSGPAWQKTMAEIEGACRKTNYDWQVAQERIATWVEHTRYDPRLGVPISVVVDRLGLLANYFQGRLKDAEGADRYAFVSGQSQALACQRALKALALQGEEKITRQQLETLVAQATAEGTGNPLIHAEVGAVRTVTRPAAAIDPAEHVVWWQLEMPALPKPYAWSFEEQESLTKAGIQLPSVEQLLEREAHCWQRPLLAASRKLTLILPPPGKELHPLWQLLESLFDKAHRPQITSLESSLVNPQLVPQPWRPLPQQKRWWHLAEQSLPKREEESFSSLESFLFNPFQWVLTYPAKLEPSSILDVSDGFLLYGTLAHHLVERYVGEDGELKMKEEEFKAWFSSAFEQLIRSEGAVLLMPGRSEDLTVFRRQLSTAMVQLRHQFILANVVKVEAEQKLVGEFEGGKIAGYGDLLVTKHDGTQAIVDMKWAGGKKYPDKLAENRHLQLVIYAELLRQRTGFWPQLAYFILSRAELLATDRNFFPEARIVWKKKEVQDENAPMLWNRFIKTWKWRRAQLDAGNIEVVLDQDEMAEKLEDGLIMEVLNPAYNDYLSLAGWGEDA